MKSYFATNRLYLWEGLVVVLFVISYFWSPLFWVAWMVIILGVAALIFDFFRLKKVTRLVLGDRSKHEKLALGDSQFIEYTLENRNPSTVIVKLIDNLPYQFQQREAILNEHLSADSEFNFNLEIRPLERGKYQFGFLFGYIKLLFPGLLERKVILDKPMLVKVYPSVIQMKKYAMYVFSKTPISYGIRRIRTVGDNDEFEHIRNYVSGDNIKSINWKATSRSGNLMVNQFQDTRSQEVYCVIDKGRSMFMPFGGMSLLDYAINSALVVSNIVLQKYDKAGLVTFSDKISEAAKAVSHPRQLEYISERLYAQETDFKTSDFEKLLFLFNGKLGKRSIIFLFTNFETQEDLERELPYLKAIARRHLMIVISFINTELTDQKADFENSIQNIYRETIIQQHLNEKDKILQILTRNGIQHILTKPEDLSIGVINKYLEIKARRMK